MHCEEATLPGGFFFLRRQPCPVAKAIGVRPLINCRGTLTIIGGSVELPEVRAAKMAAKQQDVQMDVSEFSELL